MNRLQAETYRLYLPPASAGPATLPATDAAGQVRAALLTLARPADWVVLAAVWRGVQADLALPAPAIAVSGLDAFQLWFSFAESVPVAKAAALIEGLRARYLPDIAKDRVGLMAAPVFAELPPHQTDPQLDHWSAFVAPDLAPVFAAEPWLDVPPSPEGQADLLCRLESIKPAELDAALVSLGLVPASLPEPTVLGGPSLDPTSFLLKVMNDESVAIASRIEAAKVLLGAKK